MNFFGKVQAMPHDDVIEFMNINFLNANQTTAPDFLGRLAGHVASTGQGLAVHLSNAYT